MYILTGSQQWSVLKSVSESLAGRAVFLDLEGFSLSETAENVPVSSWLERYLADPIAFVEGEHARQALCRPPYEFLWRGTLPEMDTIPEELSGDFFQEGIGIGIQFAE